MPARPAAPRGPSAGLVDYAATNHPGPDTYANKPVIGDKAARQAGGVSLRVMDVKTVED
ncbi:hypothetical protein [Tepidimonas sp. HKU79]|uniref:hypothetical protein n=1 Tax=Tepidimonas sp. HKU79 TaxID=3414505 RepID=UPI003C7EA12E